MCETYLVSGLTLSGLCTHIRFARSKIELLRRGPLPHWEIISSVATELGRYGI